MPETNENEFREFKERESRNVKLNKDISRQIQLLRKMKLNYKFFVFLLLLNFGI